MPPAQFPRKGVNSLFVLVYANSEVIAKRASPAPTVSLIDFVRAGEWIATPLFTKIHPFFPWVTKKLLSPNFSCDSLIISLAQQQGKGWEFTLFIANEERIADVENSIGMLVSIRHGDTSTYLIGYTNDEGRKQQANYVLLWEAILYAKQSGCDWFDIGGLSSITPKGVAHFKQGINAELYSSVGVWRWITVPMFGVIC